MTDILDRIDATLEAWENGEDAAHWTPKLLEDNPQPVTLPTVSLPLIDPEAINQIRRVFTAAMGDFAASFARLGMSLKTAIISVNNLWVATADTTPSQRRRAKQLANGPRPLRGSLGHAYRARRRNRRTR